MNHPSSVLASLRRSFRAPVATLLLGALMLFQVQPVTGAMIYWDGSGTDPDNWTTLGNWSTSSTLATPDPLFVPNVLDDVVFSSSAASGNQTVNITTGTTVNAFSLLFNNTGTTTLQSTTTTAATLSLRSGGLTIASGAGTVTIGNTNLLTLSTQGAQTWNLASGTTLNLGSNITRNSSVFNFTGTGTLAGAATSFNTNATTGIIGAWATYGDDWAVHPAGGSFSAYTGYTTTSGANQLLTSATTLNARLTSGSSGVTTISAADTDINTLLVNDTAARTINNNGNRLRFQGNGGVLLATGAGPLTIGAVSTASSNTGTFSGPGGAGGGDIYLTNNSTNLLTMNSALVNGAGLPAVYLAAPSLVKAGTGTVLLANGTITGHVNNAGSFIVQAGTLRQGTSRSLGFVLPGALFTNGFAGNNYTNNLTLNPGTSAATAGTFDLNGFSANVVSLSAVAGASGSSTTSTSNNARITNSVAGSSVTLTSALGGATNFNGIIENGSGTVGLTRVGASGLTLGNANTYTGTTRVGMSTAAGTLTLDFNQLGQFGVNVPSIVSSSSALELNGGSFLTITGRGRFNGANVSNSQTFNGTTLSGGSYLAWGFTDTAGLTGTDVLTIDLGALTRVGNATLQIVNNSAGGAQVTFKTPTGTANNPLTDANGTVYLTNVSDFWAKDATNTKLVAVTSTTSTATSLSGFANVIGAVSLAADTTANTVRFGAIANKIVNLNDRTLTLTNGGILAAPSATQTGAWEIRNGSLRGSSGGALSVFHYDTNNTAGLTVTAHTAGASTVTVTTGVANLAVGQAVGGTGIQPGTTITGIAGNTVTLSQPTTAGGTATFPSAIVIGAAITNNTSASALIKSGQGNLVLTSASNSYTGGTFVNGGALTLAMSGVLGSTAPVTISNGGTLAFSRTDANGSPYTFANNITNHGNVQVNTGAVNFTGIISGDGGFIKAGGMGSTVTLSGANTYRGNTEVRMGTLAVGNGGSINTGLLGGNLNVGTVAGQRGVATIGAGASVTVSSVQVGTQATSAGALYQTGGTLASLTPSASDTPFGNFIVASGNSGSYGYYRLSGGTLAVTQFGVSGNSPGNAVVDITGGTVSTLQGIGLARQGADAPLNAHNFSVLNQTGGIVSTSNGGDITFNGGGSNNNGTFTLSGGIFGSSTNNSRFNLQNTGGQQANLRANVNLNGGILQTGGFTVPAFTTATPTSGTTSGSVIVVTSAQNVRAGQLVTGTNIPANTFVTAISGTNVTLSNAVSGAITGLTFRGTGTATVNFNGGTVKLNQTAATIFPALDGAGQINGSGVYVYGSGATIDTNSFNSTSNTPLLAPTGNGVSTITVISSATGFIGAPVIVLTDTNGVPIPGASAVANMADDGTGNGTFKIDTITVTNPGINAPGTVLATVLGNTGVSNATQTAATGTLTNTSGTNTISGVTNAASLSVGQMVAAGNGIQQNTFITAINTGTNTVTLSSVTTAAVTAFNAYSLGSLTASTAANSSSGGLTKIGLGTLTLNATQGASTYTGGTTINGGGITLDFNTGSAVTTNLINSGSALSLSGGTLTLTGKASTTNSQTFTNGTTLNGGLNTFAANANVTANPLLLALGTVTRNNNATANFALPTGTQSGTNGITVSNSNNAAGILGTWATVNGTDYATVSGGNVVAASYTTANDLSTWVSGATTIYTNSAAFTNSITTTVTIPALRWNTASAANLAIGNGGTLKTDGIFFTNNLGATLGGGITGTGVLQTATAGGELVINNSTTTNAQNFIISATITDNGTSGLTKAGPTRVTLTGINTYAGPTNIVGGTLRADDGTGLPTNSLLTLNGGVFELNTAGTFSRTLGSSTGNVQITGGLSGFSNGGASASTINLGGSGGTLQWGSSTFNPTTGLVLNGAASTSAITLANGLDLNGAASRTIYHQGAAANTATISGVISNSVSGALSNLTFTAGTSTIILTGDNTYDGYTTINNGTVQVGNGGTSGRLGTGTVGVGNATLVFNRSGNFTVSNLFSGGNGNGTVTHAGAGTLSLSANNSGFFNLTASGGGTIDLLGNTINVQNGIYNNSSASGASTVATVNASAGGRIYLTANPNFGATNGSTGVSTLVINAPIENAPDVNGGAVRLSNVLINPLTGGAGIVVLNGANTYTGRTSIQNGVAQVTSIGRLDNPGTSGSLGVPYLIEQATIQLGNGGNTGTLRYVGNGETTDRAFNLFGTTGGGGFQNDGTTGALVVSSNFNATGGGAKTLTVGGFNTAANTLSGSIIDNSGTNTTALTKEGTGAWTLSGANTYTGPTLIRGGSLILDYTTNDPISATSAVTIDGGTLTFKGKSGGTTDTIASLALSANAAGTNKLILDGSAGAVNLTANTLGGSAGALASSFIDLSSNASNSLALGAIGTNYLKTNSLLVSSSGGASRANIIVKDSTGLIGFATINGATNGTVTPIANASLTTLPASSAGSGTVNYLYNGANSSITVGNGTAAFANNSITVDSSGGTATLNLAANGTINGTTTGLLVRGSNNVIVATAGGANVFQSGTWIVSNYLSGTATLNLNGNLSQTATVQINGPGLTIYSGTSLGNNQINGINFTEGTFRATTASNWATVGTTGISADATNGWFRNGGGVLEIGADLNGATAGDFSNAIVTAAGANGITFYGDSGVSAFGGNRVVNFGGAGATLLWGASGFLVNPGSANGDGQNAFKLSSAYSDSTVEVQNGINLNARTRVFNVANGSAATDALLSGNIIGGGVGGIVKNGTGTLSLSGSNSYTGVTTINVGTLQFGKQTALYNNTSASWTAANVVVRNGATAAFNVGGSGEFTTGNVTTLLTNLGGTNGTSTTGFAAGSAIGFDTTNASGGTFTVADNIANSTGTGGGAIGVTKLGTNTLVLTGINSYTGVTTINAGTLQFAKQTALYNSNTANWTAANIVVRNGATASLNVGGAGEFTTGNVTTLLTNLGGTNGTSTTGLAAGSAIGFDTTNASGGTFTVADNIANSTGTGGGALGVTKLGTNTLVLTGTNTYTGATTVTAGALQVGNAGSGQTGSGAVSVQTGSTILGTGTVRGTSFTADSGSTVQAGDSTAAGSFGTLNFTPASGGGTLSLQSSIILGIGTANNLGSIDPLFGGNDVGTAGYFSYVNDVSRSLGLGAGSHDLLSFNNPSGGSSTSLNFLTTTGSLQVLGSGFTAEKGQIFNLIDWGNLVTTNFTGFNLGSDYRDGSSDNGSSFDLPDISNSGLVWDVSQFTTSGVIVVVPEPGRALFLLIGVAGLLMRRRRQN
jgi:autotransporter-associated beta strand protein